MALKRESRHDGNGGIVTEIREPLHPGKESKESKTGQRLFNDALMLVIAAWIVVFALMLVFNRVNL